MRSRSRTLIFLATILTSIFVLSGCGFTTDTVATVGDEAITRGELNAAVASATADAQLAQSPAPDAASVLQDLIDRRLIDLAARSRNITVTDAELQAAIDAQAAQVAQGLQTDQAQTRDNLASAAARQLQPILAARGGTLSNDDLLAILRDQIGRLREVLAARHGMLAPAVSDQIVADGATGLASGLATKGVVVPPADLQPIVRGIAQQLVSNDSSVPDSFQQQLAQNGYTNGNDYRQNLRTQLLVQKMKDQWYQPVEAATLQVLYTRSLAQAQEALQKARAGTSFDDLVRAYAPPQAQDPSVVNPSSSIVLTPGLRSLFPQVQPGAYSEPFNPGNGAYVILRLVKVEQRAPTPQDTPSLQRIWLRQLRDRYPVTILDPSLRPAPGQGA